ncbi:MAG TPA: hypothetical protein VEO01_37440 [Pseudonocardiaceae bacterium]|nr:hypothetical protein [Pseudonocardiaceae bacterium]
MAGSLAWSGTGDRSTVGDVIEGVDELASAVTTALSPVGSFGSLTGTLTDGLDGVWAEFFGAATLPGGTNWNAYSHKQLYDMLWQGADVGDVSAVAAEWGRHSTALTAFADALRGQGTALRSNWQGGAAESAANRLAELSDRIWNAGARAGAVQKAVGGAGDALALARNTMPPPPPDPLTLMTSAVGAGPMSPLAAVAVGATRLFTGDATAGAAKADAVRVMQRYETSLSNSGHQVVPAQADANKSRTFQVDGATTSLSAFSGGGSSVGRGVAGGVPWAQLVGGAPLGAGGAVGGGVGPGPVQSVLAAEQAVQSELAAERAMGAGGFYPPMMGARRGNGDEDRPHSNSLPNMNDKGFFTPDERPTVPVIGDDTDRGHDVGR